MRYLALLSTLILIMLGATTSAFAIDRAVTKIATISSVSPAGTSGAKYKQGTKWTTLEKGSKIKTQGSAIIKTGAGVSVELAGGPLIKATIQPDTKVVISDLYFSRWDDHVVFKLDKGSVDVTSEITKGHRSTAVVIIDKLTGSVTEGKMSASNIKKTAVFSAKKGKSSIAEFEAGKSHNIASGQKLIIDEQGLRIVDPSKPFPWKNLLWLLLLPLVFIVKRFAFPKRKTPGRHSRKIGTEPV